MATKTPAAPWATADVAEPAGSAPAAAEAAAPAATVATETPAPAVPPAAAPQPQPAQQGTLARLDAEAEAVVSKVEQVIVTVPKAFMLRVDNDVVHAVRAGVQKMDKVLAEHWYSKANGVELFKG